MEEFDYLFEEVFNVKADITVILKAIKLLKNKNLDELVKIDGFFDDELDLVKLLISEKDQNDHPWFLKDKNELFLNYLFLLSALHISFYFDSNYINLAIALIDQFDHEEFFDYAYPTIDYYKNVLMLNKARNAKCTHVGFSSDKYCSKFCKTIRSYPIPIDLVEIPPFEKCKKGKHCSSMIYLVDNDKGK